MDERSRRAYRGLGYGFLSVGAVFALLSLSGRLFGVALIAAGAFPVALLVALIGAALLYTVRQGERKD